MRTRSIGSRTGPYRVFAASLGYASMIRSIIVSGNDAELNLR
ncbi:MAG TPA: hypothetical protein VGM92_02575 [Candidatus Kapabacteria bacterium]